MSGPAPKRYQAEAVANVLDIFHYCESQLQAAPDPASRAAATAHNGCALLEAPTGSGKTLMAGLIAEAFSRPDHPYNPKIVWFWFTPFAGLVEQSKTVFKAHFTGLRVRDLVHERVPATARSGDLFVTTWASVAAARKESRVVRTSGDTSVALDEYIHALRAAGLRVGVVVDEAHHGFAKATEAVRFYREVMRPDFTLLITATPDDADVERFKKAAGIAELHRIRVSRRDAVEAGLLKDGIKSIAYVAPDDQRELLDFGLTAIAEAWRMHGAITASLASAGIGLTPLLLVQVGNSDKAVDEARARLMSAGVPESVIAWYTSSDPNDDLLAVAKDESKEVLIFKVAVALGFDAPRAFTLVSLRGAKDADFGIQVVGRILRVHQRLQAKALARSLPELLRYGYVFLADAENQTGLTSAGERINAIRTELSKVSPYTMVVAMAGKSEVQVTRDGQATLLPIPWTPPADPGPDRLAESPASAPYVQPPLTGLLTDWLLTPPPATSERAAVAKPAVALPGNRAFPLKDGASRIHKTERLPLSTDELLRCIQATIAIDDRVFNAGLRKSVQVTRKAVDIFDAGRDEEVATLQARLSDYEIARRAQGVLFDAQYLHPRDLHQVLMVRLAAEFEQRGIDAGDEERERSLNLIMASFPNLVRKAARQCAARFKEVLDACGLPESIDGPTDARRSSRNAYGLMPQDLNGPERAFAELLDADTSGTVDYWFRNEPRKPWSIGIVLPSGERYFPDFAVKVRERSRGDGIVLVEIKGNHILNGDDTLDKVMAEHRHYGVPLMLVQEESGRFMTVRYNERRDKNELDQVFRVANLPGY